MPSPRKKVCQTKGDIDEELNELPLDGVNDLTSRFDYEITDRKKLLLKNLISRKLYTLNQRS